MGEGVPRAWLEVGRAAWISHRSRIGMWIQGQGSSLTSDKLQPLYRQLRMSRGKSAPRGHCTCSDARRPCSQPKANAHVQPSVAILAQVFMSSRRVGQTDKSTRRKK